MEGELLLPLYLYRLIRLDFVTFNLVVVLDYTIIILGGKMIQDKNEPETASTPENSKNAAGITVPDMEKLISILKEKDTSAAYKALQELERISDETGALYGHTAEFADMIKSDKYVFRVRGFRLFCRQARWDKDYILDENIDEALLILKDEKPTAVRQALAALAEIVAYKPELRETVKEAVSYLNYLKYKETMHSLIAKDIQDVLDRIKAAEE